MHFSGFSALVILAQCTQLLVSQLCLYWRERCSDLPWESTNTFCSIPPGWPAYLLLTPSHFTPRSSVGGKGTKSSRPHVKLYTGPCKWVDLVESDRLICHKFFYKQMLFGFFLGLQKFTKSSLYNKTPRDAYAPLQFNILQSSVIFTVTVIQE